VDDPAAPLELVPALFESLHASTVAAWAAPMKKAYRKFILMRVF
jgi:hypothetical protein